MSSWVDKLFAAKSDSDYKKAIDELVKVAEITAKNNYSDQLPPNEFEFSFGLEEQIYTEFLKNKEKFDIHFETLVFHIEKLELSRSNANDNISKACKCLLRKLAFDKCSYPQVNDVSIYAQRVKDSLSEVKNLARSHVGDITSYKSVGTIFNKYCEFQYPSVVTPPLKKLKK